MLVQTEIENSLRQKAKRIIDRERFKLKYKLSMQTEDQLPLLSSFVKLSLSYLRMAAFLSFLTFVSL